MSTSRLSAFRRPQEDRLARLANECCARVVDRELRPTKVPPTTFDHARVSLDVSRIVFAAAATVLAAPGRRLLAHRSSLRRWFDLPLGHLISRK